MISLKYVIFFVCISMYCQGQSNEIVFTSITQPVQLDVYPEKWFKNWEKYLLTLESTIKDESTSRSIRQIEYFNRFLTYSKMQTNHPEELLSVFMDAFTYDPYYMTYEYKLVYPLKDKAYESMWDNCKKEKQVIDSLTTAVLDSHDPQLVEQVQKLKEQDQYYRKEIGAKTLEELKEDGSWEKQHELDLQNATEIEAILNRIGYPGRSAVGFTNESAVFLVIQHSNLRLMEYGLPYVQKAIDDLDLDAKYFALLYDRIQLVKKLPQLYGTQNNIDGSLYELSDPKNVNERRKLYGLYPLNL